MLTEDEKLNYYYLYAKEDEEVLNRLYKELEDRYFAGEQTDILSKLWSIFVDARYKNNQDVINTVISNNFKREDYKRIIAQEWTNSHKEYNGKLLGRLWVLVWDEKVDFGLNDFMDFYTYYIKETGRKVYVKTPLVNGTTFMPNKELDLYKVSVGDKGASRDYYTDGRQKVFMLEVFFELGDILQAFEEGNEEEDINTVYYKISRGMDKYNDLYVNGEEVTIEQLTVDDKVDYMWDRKVLKMIHGG